MLHQTSRSSFMHNFRTIQFNLFYFNEVFITKGLKCKDFSLVFLLLARVFQAMRNGLCLYYFLFQLLYIFSILLTIRRECRNGRKESDVVRTLL